MMFRSWAVVFRIKFVAVQRLLVVLSVLSLLVLGQVPATARPWQSKKATHSSKSSAKQRKLRHINKAFVASADLRPMAQQLLQNRTPQAYAGVEAYAHQHQADEAGPLAHLVLGYAHYLDNDFPKALASWQRAKGIAPVPGDYLAFLNASAYQAQQKNQDVITALADFENRKSRADLLLKGKRYQPAANDLSSLLEHAPSAALTELQAEFATALYRLHKRDDAQHLFEGLVQSGAAASESKAQALYFLAEIAREKNDNDHRTELIAQLRTLAPESPWLQEALLLA